MARAYVFDAVQALLEKNGLTCSRHVTGKGHMKILFQANDKPLIYVCSKTSSDRRATDNACSDVRRMLREAGLTVAR